MSSPLKGSCRPPLTRSDCEGGSVVTTVVAVGSTKTGAGDH